MDWVALRMLAGDRTRYLVAVLGVAFSALLMGHQLSVYLGVMDRTCSLILDSNPDGIWVMDPGVLNLDDARRLPDGALLRVRGVEGVAWAAPLFKGQALVHTERGQYRLALIVGVDDDSLIGLPGAMVEGSVGDLRRPDAVVVDEAGCSYLWPEGAEPRGLELKVNDRRATVVGVCRASPPFLSSPVIYTRMSNARRFCPTEPRHLSYVLVGAAPGVAAAVLCRRITAQTGLDARTGRAFAERTRAYYRANTAIMANFALVVALGFAVGAAVAGQVFFLFTVHHLKDYAQLRAMGVDRVRLARMVLLQAGAVWWQGYGLGIGAAAVALEVTSRSAPYLAGFVIRGPGVAGAGVATLLIMAAAGLVSLSRVLRVPPASIASG